MIAAYSLQAKGRRESSFRRWQARLLQELPLGGIREVDAAN